jgi:hypothetical protein
MTTLLHHLTTLALVVLSAQVGYTRFGGVIMFFFDWANIPLLGSLLCKNLSKDPHDTLQYTANRLFELFALIFFATRNILYSYVVYAAVLDLPANYKGHISRTLLVILVFLQTYWMHLVIQAAIRQAKTGAVAWRCVREDDKTNVAAKKWIERTPVSRGALTTPIRPSDQAHLLRGRWRPCSQLTTTTPGVLLTEA